MADAEVWHVQLASGGSRAMTLDELDAAFQAGRIDASSPVLAPGASSWSTLGEIAGLDAAPEMPASRSPAPPAPTPRVSIDLDVDVEALRAPKRGWKRIVLIAAPIAAAIAVVASLASRSSASAEATSTPPSAVAAPSASSVAGAPSPAPSTTTKAPSPVLSDSQKRALAAADAKREQAQKAKAVASKVRAKIAAPKRKPSSGAGPFTKGTDRHDPLNGTL